MKTLDTQGFLLLYQNFNTITIRYPLDTVDCFYYILGLFGYRSNKLNTTFCKLAP